MSNPWVWESLFEVNILWIELLLFRYKESYAHQYCILHSETFELSFKTFVHTPFKQHIVALYRYNILSEIGQRFSDSVLIFGIVSSTSTNPYLQ